MQVHAPSAPAYISDRRFAVLMVCRHLRSFGVEHRWNYSIMLAPLVFCSCRGSFPAESQFQHLMRFITDERQTPNVRVIAAVLNYLTVLAQVNMKPNDLKNSSSSRLGLTKIINWCMDGKTPDIRKSSQQVLVVLRQLNEQEFSAMVDTLDQFLRVSTPFLAFTSMNETCNIRFH